MAKTIETRHVFLDTQVFVSHNFDYVSATFDSLKTLTKNKKIFVYLTEITCGEVESNIEEEVLKARGSFQSLQSNKTKILHNLTGPIKDALQIKFDVDEIKNTLVTQFNQFLTDISATILPVDQTSVSKVFKKYFSRKPPFSDKKKEEFPDAFTLAALEQWCTETQNKLYVISADSDLVASCDNKTLLSIENLKEFLDRVVAEDGINYEVAHEIYRENKDRVIKLIKKEFPDRSFYLDDFHSDIYGVTVTSVDIKKEYLVDVEDGNATFELTVDVSFEAEASIADIVVEDYVVEWRNETFDREVTISVELYLSYDRNSRDLYDCSIGISKNSIVVSSWEDLDYK